jgi:hypothetical protein
MNPVQMRQHRTITERLSDRLDVLEPLVDRMMRNGDALYQGHEANAARIAALNSNFEVWRDVLETCNRECDTLRRWRVHLEGASVWRRLLWALTGVIE